MTDTRKAQLEIAADGTPAQAAFDQVAKSGQAMANSVDASGKKMQGAIAGVGSTAKVMGAEVDASVQIVTKGVKKQADEADASSKKQEQATNRIIASIQRHIAATEAGGFGTAKYYETIASQKNLNLNTMQPYINQLRAIEQAHGATTISAGQMKNALRGVPAQFTDIATSLASGQSPMLVMLQQGGQLKDMFGGIGLAARALGGYMLGLINPVTMAAVAIGVTATAFYQGSREANEFRNALLMTGNAAGVTKNQLSTMATAMDAQFGVTTAKAAEALTALAATGEVSQGRLQQFAQVGIDIEKAFGIPLEKTVKNFEDLGREPVKASLKLNESLRYLTAATLEQITEAERLGEKERAAEMAQIAFSYAMQSRTSHVKESLGFLERAWLNVGSVAKEAWGKMLNVGRDEELDEQIARLEKRIATFSPALTRADQVQLALLKAKKQAEEDAAKAQQNSTLVEDAAVKSRQAIVDTNKGYLSSQDQITEKLQQYGIQLAALAKANPNDALLDPAKVQQTIDGIMGLPQKAAESAKFAADITSKSIADQTAQVQHLVNMRVLTEEEGIQQLGKLRLKDLQAQKSTSDAAASAYAADAEKSLQYRRQSMLASMDIANQEKQIIREVEELRRSQYIGKVNEIDASTDAIQKQIDAQLESNVSLGLGVVALAEHKRALDLDRASALENQAALLAFKGGNDELVASLEKQAQKIRELADERVNGAKLSEWQRVATQIQDTITGALMRGFESGKGFFENFRDTLKNTILTVTVQPIIKSMVGSLLGLGGASAFAGGVGGSDPFSSLSKMWSVASLNFDKSIASMTSALTQAGDYMATSSNSLASASGQWLQGFAVNAGTYARYGLGAGVGLLAGNAISGDYSALGSNKNTATLIGTAIGAAMGGPLGAAIGGAAGGLFNRAFGMGSVETTGSKLVGYLGIRSGVSLATQTSYHQDGGWFRSDKNWTQTNGLSRSDLLNVYMSVEALRNGVETYTHILGGSTAALNSFTLSVNSTGTVADALKSYADGLAQTVGNFAAFAKAGETASAAMERLAVATTQYDAIATLLYGSAPKASEYRNAAQIGLWDAQNWAKFDPAKRAADKAAVMDAFGGADAFAQSAQAYFSNFYTAAEQAARRTELLTKQFADLGVSMPKTREEFKKLVDEAAYYASQGGTQAASETMNQYKSLMNLSSAFAELVPWTTKASDAADSLAKSLADFAKQFSDTMDSLTKERTSLEDQLYQLQLSLGQASMTERERYLSKNTAGMSTDQIAQIGAAYDYNAALKEQIYALQDQQSAAQAAQQAAQQQAQAAEQLRQAWLGIGQTIEDEVNRIRGLMADGADGGFASLQAQFATATAQARAGDQTAAKSLAVLSQSMLAAYAGRAGSKTDYLRMAGLTAGSLSQTVASLGIGSTPVLSLVPSASPAAVQAVSSPMPVSVPQADTSLSSGISSLLAELRTFSQNNTAQNEGIARQTATMARILTDVSQDGRALSIVTNTGDVLKVKTT